MPSERSLLQLGLLVRLALATIALAAQLPLWDERSDAGDARLPPSLRSHYDASAQLMQLQATRECTHLASSPIERAIITALNSQVHWDGLHFLSILYRRGYDVEKETAFFPGLPLIGGCIASGFAKVFALLGVPLCSYTAVLIAAALLSLALFLTNVVLLYRLSLTVLSSPRLAYLSAVAFVFSPAAVFHTALYSEGMFTACAMGGMLLRERGRSWGAAVLFAVATSCRANGYLLAGFFLWDALQSTRSAAAEEKLHGSRRVMQIAVGWIAAVVQSAIVFAPFVAFQLYAASLVCTSSPLASSSASPPPYCSAFFPNIYSFVQSQYWNVGWFRYYELRQLPNFLLAAPVWTLSLVGIGAYAQQDWKRFATLGFRSTAVARGDSAVAAKQPLSNKRIRAEPSSQHQQSLTGFACDRALVYIYLWSGLLFICITVLHVQVSTRFLSFCPPLYWFAATKLDSAFSLSASFPSFGAATLLRVWSAVYMLSGTVLFSSFLPWT